jgi:hypothetical protein
MLCDPIVCRAIGSTLIAFTVRREAGQFPSEPRGPVDAGPKATFEKPDQSLEIDRSITSSSITSRSVTCIAIVQLK